MRILTHRHKAVANKNYYLCKIEKNENTEKKMKKFILTLLTAVVSLTAFAQMAPQQAASWTSKVVMEQNGNAVIEMTMKVNPGWHVYAPGQTAGGPVSMTFDFSKSPGITLVGEPQPSVVPTKKHDASFGLEVKYWDHTVTFRQKIRITDASARIDGTVRFQGCNDKTCTPPVKIKIAPRIPN